MQNFIACWFGWVRGLFVPRAPGRHRRDYAGPVVSVRRCGVRRDVEWLDAEVHAIVRPYLVAHERRIELLRRQQRERRRALLLAAWGVDVGPRRIHGVEVAR